MAALAIPADFRPAMGAPTRLGALTKTLRQWQRVMRHAVHSDRELKLFGRPSGDDPELAALFLRYPPI